MVKRTKTKKIEYLQKPIIKKSIKKEYVYAIGRRKTAVAQVRLFSQGTGEIIVNNIDFPSYFPYSSYQQIVTAPLIATGLLQKITISIKVKGGGKKSQAEAARLGISRALILKELDLRKTLKPLGFLTRDPREKERKKPGLKRARRAPQWQKR